EEANRHFSRLEPHVYGLQHHFRGVLPRLRLQIHADEGGLADAAHAAMNVGKVAGEDDVQDPRRPRRTEVAVQGWHRTGLDVAAKARAHHELRAVVKLFHERDELAKVVGAIAITHQDVLAADVRQGILI